MNDSDTNTWLPAPAFALGTDGEMYQIWYNKSGGQQWRRVPRLEIPVPVKDPNDIELATSSGPN